MNQLASNWKEIKVRVKNTKIVHRSLLNLLECLNEFKIVDYNLRWNEEKRKYDCIVKIRFLHSFSTIYYTTLENLEEIEETREIKQNVAERIYSEKHNIIDLDNNIVKLTNNIGMGFNTKLIIDGSILNNFTIISYMLENLYVKFLLKTQNNQTLEITMCCPRNIK